MEKKQILRQKSMIKNTTVNWEDELSAKKNKIVNVATNFLHDMSRAIVYRVQTGWLVTVQL